MINSDLVLRNADLANFLGALPVDDVAMAMEAVLAGLGDAPRIASDGLSHLLLQSELISVALEAKESTKTKISTLVDKTRTEAALLAHVAEFGFHRYGPRNPVFEFIGHAVRGVGATAADFRAYVHAIFQRPAPRARFIHLDDDWVDLGDSDASRARPAGLRAGNKRGRTETP